MVELFGGARAWGNLKHHNELLAKIILKQIPSTKHPRANILARNARYPSIFRDISHFIRFLYTTVTPLPIDIHV